MAELIRLDVAEALRTRDYPIILRDRKLLLSEQSMNVLAGIALALSIAIYLSAVYWFGATRVQLHILEAGGVIAWGAFYIILSELRRENILELNATGLVLRPHTASKPTEIAWNEILSIAAEGGDVILMRQGELPYQQTLLREGFGFRDPNRLYFGASVADILKLLETHWAANQRIPAA